MLSSESEQSDNTSNYFPEEPNHPDLPPQPTNTPEPLSSTLHTSPLCIMQLEQIPEFSRTQEDKIQPSDFLKAIKRLFLASRTTTDDQKIGLFELYLKSDLPAEEWFNDAKTPKKTWLELDLEFKARFPNIKKATRTAAKLERELGAIRITMEKLGRTEKFRGEDVYTHTIFTEKFIDLSKQVKIETTTSSL
jgi:hypothetical protein